MYAGNGQVAQVSAKPFTDKWGKQITLYSFQLQGDNSWYRTGTTPPPCQQGQVVQFTFEQQGNNKKVDPNSIQPTGEAPSAPVQQPPQQQPKQATSGARTNTRDDYWKQKEAYDKEVTQPRIAYAAAQKSAVSIVTAALANDVLGFGNAKKADKMEMLLGYVDEVTIGLALKLDSAHEILARAKEADGQTEASYNEDDMYADS